MYFNIDFGTNNVVGPWAEVTTPRKLNKTKTKIILSTKVLVQFSKYYYYYKWGYSWRVGGGGVSGQHIVTVMGMGGEMRVQVGGIRGSLYQRPPGQNYTYTSAWGIYFKLLSFSYTFRNIKVGILYINIHYYIYVIIMIFIYRYLKLNIFRLTLS